MKYLFLILVTACISCNRSGEKNTVQDDTLVGPKIDPPAPEDSVTLKLRGAITAIETQELQQTNVIRTMFIDSIRHEMVSLKDFYTVKKEELAKEVKFSTDKVKTARALAYLDKMVIQASVKPVLYKTDFHLNALLGNNTQYNDRYTRYLKNDLSEIKVVFPN